MVHSDHSILQKQSTRVYIQDHRRHQGDRREAAVKQAISVIRSRIVAENKDGERQ